MSDLPELPVEEPVDDSGSPVEPAPPKLDPPLTEEEFQKLVDERNNPKPGKGPKK